MGKKILVTGGTGFVGSWVVKLLLEKGYELHIAARNPDNLDKIGHLNKMKENTSGSIHLFKADLLEKGSFDAKAKEVDAIMHIASPFILNPKDPQKELVDPALEGTRNVLNAANQSTSVKKVILTSSVAAVYGDNRDMEKLGLDQFTEEQFNTSSTLNHNPYQYSKVIAEKEAWKIEEAQSNWKLVVINPSFVIGPSLTNNSDSESLVLMNDILKGKYKMGVPNLYFGFVDVRDIATAHVNALENDNASGRHILNGAEKTLLDLTKTIGDLFPNKYKLPKSESPKWLFKLVGPMFGVKRKFVENNVGYKVSFDNSKSIKSLNVEYHAFEKTVKDMVDQMDN